MTFSWSFAGSSFKFFLDFFLSKLARFVEDFDFFGLPSSFLVSIDDTLVDSVNFSLPRDFIDRLLLDFLCIVGLLGSSDIGTRRGCGGLLICRSPKGVSVEGVLLRRILDTSFSFRLPRRNWPTEGVLLCSIVALEGRAQASASLSSNMRVAAGIAEGLVEVRGDDQV